MNTADVFKDRLKAVRQKLGLTQAEMARLMEVSRATVGFYENGERLPDISVLSTLVLKTEVPASYYLGFTESQKDEFTDVSLITGLDDEAISVLANSDTYALSALLKHPAFDEMIEHMALFISPILKAEADEGVIEIARARAHICLEKILSAAINGDKIKFIDEPDNTWYRPSMLDRILLQDEELKNIFGYTERMREYLADKRRTRASLDWSRKTDEDIQTLRGAIELETKRIHLNEERINAYTSAIERVQTQTNKPLTDHLTK